MQDKFDPARFDLHAGGYRIVDRNGLLDSRDASIPNADKTDWRDLVLADAYVRQTLKQTRPPRPAIRPAWEFPLVTESMALTFHLELCGEKHSSPGFDHPRRVGF
jgi:hypothetical protein